MKLEWQQNSPSKPISWYEAIEYAKLLEDGWRLPTEEELKEAYDNNVEGFQSNYYWSSSTYAQNTSYVWVVNSNDGDVFSNRKTNSYYVRCVRKEKIK